jgi:DNA (cytosine-5)-methyltransferase 1
MQLKALDLFAGCGGLSLGLEEAGIDVVLANEIDAWAADTYEHNHPDTHLLRGDVRSIRRTELRALRGEIDLVAGGPPCQGFSISGRRQFGEVPLQNTLVEAYLNVVEQVRPRLVLMENVGGFRTAQLRPGVPALPYVLERLKGLGYVSTVLTLQAADYGVPSLRSRVFMVAMLGSLSADPTPVPTFGPRPGRRYRSCLEAISDLPSLDAGQGMDGLHPYAAPADNKYQSSMRESSTGVANHVAMRHTPRLVQRFRTIQSGSSSYRSVEGVTVYKSNNQRLIGDIPSLCITANFQSNYIHPVQHRNLTAREAARLMTFPDWYFFKGKRTLMSKTLLDKEGRSDEANLSQYNQIGNAVPPVLARELGEKLISIATAGKRRPALVA